MRGSYDYGLDGVFPGARDAVRDALLPHGMYLMWADNHPAASKQFFVQIMRDCIDASPY